MTHYQVLGVAPSASDDRIDRAYHGRLELLHDDAHAAPTAAERRSALLGLIRIHEAYRALNDPQRRRAYDGWLALDVPSPLEPPRIDGPRGRCPVCARVVRLVDPAPATSPAARAAEPALTGPVVEVVAIEPLPPAA